MHDDLPERVFKASERPGVKAFEPRPFWHLNGSARSGSAADPFAPDNGPLRYLVGKGAFFDGSDRPVVYSVNLNGVDDTPGASVLPSAPQFGWRRSRDAYVDLARWPQPATQPADPR